MGGFCSLLPSSNAYAFRTLKIYVLSYAILWPKFSSFIGMLQYVSDIFNYRLCKVVTNFLTYGLACIMAHGSVNTCVMDGSEKETSFSPWLWYGKNVAESVGHLFSTQFRESNLSWEGCSFGEMCCTELFFGNDFDVAKQNCVWCWSGGGEGIFVRETLILGIDAEFWCSSCMLSF